MRASCLPIAAALPLCLLPLAAGCYQPDLGTNPWYCSKDTSIPPCPEGYDCVENICLKHSSVVDGSTSFLPDPKDCPDKDIEPNDDKGQATLLGVGHSVGWAICTRTDKDFYQIQLHNNDAIKIVLVYQPIGSSGNLDMKFWGGTIAEKMPTPSFPDVQGKLLVARAQTTKPIAETDTFYLEVFGADQQGGPNFYELDVTLPK
jgi:hypothetical protein